LPNVKPKPKPKQKPHDHICCQQMPVSGLWLRVTGFWSLGNRI